MNDWLDYAGEHIDKIEWDFSHRVWVISNTCLKVHAPTLGAALDKFQREWSAMNS